MAGYNNWGYANHWWSWVFPLVILDMFLRALALWRSARAQQKWWFVALLVVNSLGILPAIYLLTHKEKEKAVKKPKKKSR